MGEAKPFSDDNPLYDNPFEVAFSGMKIRYVTYASMIRSAKFLKPADKVSVFINIETLLNSLSSIKDIGNLVLKEQFFPVIMESGIINLTAHYKRFFRKFNLDVKVFLYYTDLSRESYKNNQYEHYYRSYYQNKFMENPNYYLIGERMVKDIVPMVSKILEFIPDVYFIKTESMDSSLVPYVVSKMFPDRKNFIITGDNYDTQYMNYPNFFVSIIRRTGTGNLAIRSLDKIIPMIFRDNMAVVNNVDIFYNKMFYSMCLAVTGDHRRSIKSIRGVGPKTLSNKIKKAIDNGDLTRDCTSIDVCCTVLDRDNDLLAQNCRCINLDSQYADLTDSDFFAIKNQIVDRYDQNSLEELNTTRYQYFPLMLNELTH